MLESVDAAVSFIRSRTSIQPAVGVILGSGLGNVVEAIDAEVSIPYSEIPGARASTDPDYLHYLIESWKVRDPLRRVADPERWPVEYEEHLTDEHAELVGKLETSPKFDAELEGAIRKAITDFKDQYVKDNANVVAA